MIPKALLSLQRPQLPPKLRAFPSGGMMVVKKSICTFLAFQKSAFQIWTQRTDYSSDHRHCFWRLGGQIVGFCFAQRHQTQKLDAEAIHSQRRKQLCHVRPSVSLTVPAPLPAKYPAPEPGIDLLWWFVFGSDFKWNKFLHICPVLGFLLGLPAIKSGLEITLGSAT